MACNHCDLHFLRMAIRSMTKYFHDGKLDWDISNPAGQFVSKHFKCLMVSTIYYLLIT